MKRIIINILISAVLVVISFLIASEYNSTMYCGPKELCPPTVLCACIPDKRVDNLENWVALLVGVLSFVVIGLLGRKRRL